MVRAAAALMALFGMVLAGCSSPAAVTESAPSTRPEFVAQSAPDGFERWDLVGLWRVSDAQGTDGDTWLYLGSDEARVWSDCGFQFGGWSAGGGRLRRLLTAGDKADSGQEQDRKRSHDIPSLERRASTRRQKAGMAMGKRGRKQAAMNRYKIAASEAVRRWPGRSGTGALRRPSRALPRRPGRGAA